MKKMKSSETKKSVKKTDENITPVVEMIEAPKKRGRKAKSAELVSVVEAPKKRGRKPKAVVDAATDTESKSKRSVSIGQQIINKMKRGVVAFTFINRMGKEITTKGTLIKSKIPTTRKVAGAVKPRNHDMVVFYDTRHGIRRQFDRNKVVGFA